MRVYLGGLWSGIGRKDLDRLVRQTLRGPWYKLHMPRGQLADCELLELVERKTGHTEHCAVIEVEPHRLGWELVQQLDGINYRGRVLRAHRWFPRKGLADRRGSTFNEEAPEAMARDRRAGRDRRRPLDIRPAGRQQVSAVSGFQRSYGS